MERERVKNALARIEAAAARIEAAAGRAHSRDAGDRDDGDLAGKHAALKASVGQTLRELDDLIARMEA